MKVVGDGVFGTFLKSILNIDLVEENPKSVILAVPLSAYAEVSKQYAGLWQINVCSVQEESTNICLENTDKVTSIHPLFGPRTPKEYWAFAFTFSSQQENTGGMSDEENLLIDLLFDIAPVYNVVTGCQQLNPRTHDQLMAMTHKLAIQTAHSLEQKILKATEKVPQHLWPYSFRMLRNLVNTLNDTPSGTIESIMSNPY